MQQEANRIASVLIINELLPRLKRAGLDIKDCPISPQELKAAAILKAAGLVSTMDIRFCMDEKFAKQKEQGADGQRRTSSTDRE